MKIFVQARGFNLTDDLRQHVERRLRFALDWAHYHVTKVSVRLSDLNGPRGGEDKRCQIQVSAAGAAEVVIEDTEVDLYIAIDRAADRAGRTLARQLGRQREHRRDIPLAKHLLADDVEPEIQTTEVKISTASK